MPNATDKPTTAAGRRLLDEMNVDRVENDGRRFINWQWVVDALPAIEAEAAAAERAAIRDEILTKMASAFGVPSAISRRDLRAMLDAREPRP